jgi:hypothetical protein
MLPCRGRDNLVKKPGDTYTLCLFEVLGRVLCWKHHAIQIFDTMIRIRLLYLGAAIYTPFCASVALKFYEQFRSRYHCNNRACCVGGFLPA